MKKLFLPIMALGLLGAMDADAQENDSLTYDLQEVQVVSTRASNKTPIAFSDMNLEDI